MPGSSGCWLPTTAGAVRIGLEGGDEPVSGVVLVFHEVAARVDGDPQIVGGVSKIDPFLGPRVAAALGRLRDARHPVHAVIRGDLHEILGPIDGSSE